MYDNRCKDCENLEYCMKMMNMPMMNMPMFEDDDEDLKKMYHYLLSAHVIQIFLISPFCSINKTIQGKIDNMAKAAKLLLFSIVDSNLIGVK